MRFKWMMSKGRAGRYRNTKQTHKNPLQTINPLMLMAPPWVSLSANYSKNKISHKQMYRYLSSVFNIFKLFVTSVILILQPDLGQQLKETRKRMCILRGSRFACCQVWQLSSNISINSVQDPTWLPHYMALIQSDLFKKTAKPYSR